MLASEFLDELFDNVLWSTGCYVFLVNGVSHMLILGKGVL